MIRTRRTWLAFAAVWLAIGGSAQTPALATNDFAIFGMSMSSSVEIESADLLGEWKDESWRRVAWRVNRANQPGTFIVTRVHKDGLDEVFRGILVHGKTRGDFLDLTPATNAPPEQSAIHLFFKVEMIRVDGFSIGTLPRVRKAFDGHIGKSYHTLVLRPAKPSKFRELYESDPKAFGGVVEGSGHDILVIANPTQAAKLLADFGGESGVWKSDKDATTLMQRRTSNSD